MSKICKIVGKKPMTGNRRSHSMNAAKRKFFPNLQKHKFWIESKKCFIKLKLSTKAIRCIDKKGIEEVLLNIKNKNFRRFK